MISLEMSQVFGIGMFAIIFVVVAWGIGYRFASDRGQLIRKDINDHYEHRIAEHYVKRGYARTGYDNPWRLCVEAVDDRGLFGDSVRKTIYIGDKAICLDDFEALTMIVEAVNHYYKLKKVS